MICPRVMGTIISIALRETVRCFSSPPNEDVVFNPVPLFPVDNNGVVVSLPAIPDHGQKTTNGSSYFGIGTRTTINRVRSQPTG